MKPTILLFDIDGTLVTTGGAGRRALQAAFERLHGTAEPCRKVSFEGMTDRAIVREALRNLGEPPLEEAIDEVLASYLELLSHEIPRSNPTDYRVHPGVFDVLAAAESRTQCAIGLGTGNVRDGARLKLEHVNLFRRFSFGGFGCDHENRVELIRTGAMRGASALGFPLERCRLVIIGDTPKDVSAALAVGGECIGVGTGTFTPDALVSCGAKFAFPDLTHPDAIACILEG